MAQTTINGRSLTDPSSIKAPNLPATEKLYDELIQLALPNPYPFYFSQIPVTDHSNLNCEDDFDPSVYRINEIFSQILSILLKDPKAMLCEIKHNQTEGSIIFYDKNGNELRVIKSNSTLVESLVEYAGDGSSLFSVHDDCPKEAVQLIVNTAKNHITLEVIDRKPLAFACTEEIEC